MATDMYLDISNKKIIKDYYLSFNASMLSLFVNLEGQRKNWGLNKNQCCKSWNYETWKQTTQYSEFSVFYILILSQNVYFLLLSLRPQHQSGGDHWTYGGGHPEGSVLHQRGSFCCPIMTVESLSLVKMSRQHWSLSRGLGRRGLTGGPLLYRWHAPKIFTDYFFFVFLLTIFYFPSTVFVSLSTV